MSAPHFFVPPLSQEPSLVALTEQDSRHALRSLRLKPGEDATVSDGLGRVGHGVLLRTEEGRAVIEVQQVEEVTPPQPRVSLIVSPPKGERLRWMVQKLAEIGAHSVLLAESERSVRTLEEERMDGLIRRLNAIAREAAMQSRQPYLMEVRAHLASATGVGIASSHDGDQLMVVLHEGATAGLHQALPLDPPDLVTLAVGPEGGFSAAEIESARRAGTAVASLGSNVLRTETAAIVGATLVLARYGRLG